MQRMKRSERIHTVISTANTHTLFIFQAFSHTDIQQSTRTQPQNQREQVFQVTTGIYWAKIIEKGPRLSWGTEKISESSLFYKWSEDFTMVC